MIKQTRRKGLRITTQEGHLRYQLPTASQTFLAPLATLLSNSFDLQVLMQPIVFVSEICGEIGTDRSRLTFGWDDRSGVYLEAQEVKDNPLVQQLGDFLDRELKASIYQHYLGKKRTEPGPQS